MLIADGIKQKSAFAELKMRVNRDIIKSYREDSKKTINLVRLTFTGQFNKMM